MRVEPRGWVALVDECGQPEGMNRMTEPMLQGKTHDIPKRLVWDAWLKVKENKGAAGADGARPFQDHDVSPRIVKGRSMERPAHRVASVMSGRPARRRAPIARLRRAAMILGPFRVLTWDLSSCHRVSRTQCKDSIDHCSRT
jgi:hypothetical protein